MGGAWAQLLTTAGNGFFLAFACLGLFVSILGDRSCCFCGAEPLGCWFWADAGEDPLSKK